MFLIGNEIRLARMPLASAVSQRREQLIKTMARRQVEAGANWLLLDLGPQRKDAGEDLAWLVRTVQDEIVVPLALRGDDPVALEAGIQVAHGQALIDATLPGVEDPDAFLDLARRHDAAAFLQFRRIQRLKELQPDQAPGVVVEPVAPRDPDGEHTAPGVLVVRQRHRLPEAVTAQERAGTDDAKALLAGRSLHHHAGQGQQGQCACAPEPPSPGPHRFRVLLPP